MLSILILTSLAIAAVCFESIEHSVVIDMKKRAQQSIRDLMDQPKLSKRLGSQSAVSTFPSHANDSLYSDKKIHSRDTGFPPSRLRHESTVTYAYMKNSRYGSSCSGTPYSDLVIASDVCIVDPSGSYPSVEFDITGDTSTNQITSTSMKFSTSDCSGSSDTESSVFSQNTCVSEEINDDEFENYDDDDDKPVKTGTYVGYSSEPSVSYNSLIVTFYSTVAECESSSSTFAAKLYDSYTFGQCHYGIYYFSFYCSNSEVYRRTYYYSSNGCSGTYEDSLYELFDCSTNYKSLSCQDNEDDDSSLSVVLCFSGYETVTMESGEDKLISDVVIGDRILSYSSSSKSFVYSDVVYIPHAKNDELASFNKITTTTGQVITLSPDHLIMSGDCMSVELNLKAASMIKAGECLLNQRGKHEEVESVAMVKLNGVYTVITQEEFIVVSGFVSSPFAVNHYFANKYYNIHRFLYSYVPSLMKTSVFDQFQGVANYFANYVATF